MSRLLDGDPEVATGGADSDGAVDCFRADYLRAMERCRPTTSKRALLREGRPTSMWIAFERA
jgi:hypothetical protein